MALNHDLVRRVFGDKAVYSFEAAPPADDPKVKMAIENLHVSYGRGLRGAAQGLFSRLNRNDHSIHSHKNRALGLKDVTLPIYENEVLALIGSSGCGKSTLLRALNRMNDTIDGCITTGNITLDGQNIYDRDVEAEVLRRRVGMVFQKPNPFVSSIRDNVAYGISLHGLASSKEHMDDLIEEHLTKAGLFDEVKDVLKRDARSLSGDQQQRLCIARATAIQPEVILMDEPCASLDPISSKTIEDRIHELQQDYTIVLITHNLGQAARLSQRVAHFHLGEMLSYGPTEEIYKNTGAEPSHADTLKYVQGAFG